MTMGEYRNWARTQKGYSIRELSEKSQISTAEISRLESGKRLRPSPGVLKALAEALSIDYSTLMQMAGYIEEMHEGEKTFEQVFIDENTGEIVDVVRGVKKMYQADADWANVAYRVSQDLSYEDRKVLTELAKTYLERRRRELEAEKNG